ncbi:MAG: AfsR/SARP family transcriptional regulator, partial [Chloroflexota bacterium]
SAAGHCLSREQATALLWPDEELSSAANSLREVLSKLRRRLRGDDAATLSDAYVRNQGMHWLALVGETVWIDADAFAETAAAALKGDDLTVCRATLDLYRGEYLAGQSTDQLRDHLSLIRRRRRTLRRLYVDLLAHAGVLCEADDPQGAAEYYRRALALNPLAEEHSRRAMALLAGMGELSAMRETYTILTKGLARQGLTPSRETISLHDRLLAAGTVVVGRAPTVSPTAGLQTVLAVGETGAPPASVLAVARAHGGTALPSSAAGPWLFTFPIPAAALEASWTLMAPAVGSAIPRGLSLALHTKLIGPTEGARYAEPELARVLAAQAHGGQVLVSRATQAVAGASLPAGSVLLPLDRYDLTPGRPAEMVYQLTRAGSPVVFPPLKAPLHRPHNLPAALTRYLERPRLETRLSVLLAPSDDHNQA